jgi:shikimate kinase
LGGDKKNMKIILIGYRASGKSTLGKLLAAKLKIPFWDADLLVEENMGIPIKEIVAAHGWDFFRTREKETIQRLSQKGACVIATGGGVILDKENVDLLKTLGIVIWINAPLQDIIERLVEDKKAEATRPQFTAGSLVQETIDILRKRIPLYEKAADMMIETAGQSAPQTAEKIYQYLLESGNLALINKSRNKVGTQTV